MGNGQIDKAAKKVQELYERLLPRRYIQTGIKTKRGVKLFY